MNKFKANNFIRDNYLRVLDQIRDAVVKSDRDPDSIRLVVVTKSHPASSVQRVIEAGACLLGENYVEEALEKMRMCPDASRVDWHMIGHIQSRKARLVCENFHAVHSLDSVKLARRLDRFAAGVDHKLPVMMECNVSGEASKYGWSARTEDQFENLIPIVDELLTFSNLNIVGLMTMPPFSSNPEHSRPYFQRIRELQQYLWEHFPTANWRELSMGMSQDYMVAIEEGATMLRIGTAVMGPRPV